MADSNPNISPVKDEHFRAFGAIVHMFARHEFLLIGMVAKMIKCEVHQAAMLMAELPYRGKRDTVLAFMKLFIQLEITEKISGYMGQLHSHNRLRNNIAHSIWVPGKRPESIKPMSMSVRGGEANPIGVAEDEKDYTAKELIQIAEQLMRLHTNFRDYLRTNDLFPPMSNLARSKESTSGH